MNRWVLLTAASVPGACRGCKHLQVEISAAGCVNRVAASSPERRNEQMRVFFCGFLRDGCEFSILCSCLSYVVFLVLMTCWCPDKVLSSIATDLPVIERILWDYLWFYQNCIRVKILNILTSSWKTNSRIFSHLFQRKYIYLLAHLFLNY